MKGRLLLELAGLAAAMLLVWLGFVFLDVSPDISGLKISREKEMRFGEIMAEALLDEYEEITRKKVTHPIAKIEKRLLKAVGDTDNEYTFIVVKSEIVNAITLPGGYVVIFSGLLEVVDSAEELAAVMAHEIAHTELNHVAKKLAKTVGIEVIANVLGGGDAALFSEVVKLLTSSVFDRSQEREADRYALDLLVKAQINPRVLAKFFRKLAEIGPDFSDELEIISSHPGNQSRMKAVLQYPVPSKARFKKIKINWRRVKKAVNRA